MPVEVGNNINSAILSATFGFRNASQGITEASINIAQRNAEARDVTDLLADAASQQLGAISQVLPSGGDSLTNDRVSLSINATNAQANAKVLDVANERIGRIIDELA